MASKVPIPLAAMNRRLLALSPETRPSAFTIMTWNTLAQVLVKRELFPYCTKGELKFKTRLHRLFDEVRHYRPSILCLQEVDRENWSTRWGPFLTELNYQWRYYGARDKRHGCCVAWRATDWHCLDYRRVDLDRTQVVANYEPAEANVAQVVALVRRTDLSTPLVTTTTPGAEPEDPDHPNAFTSDVAWRPDRSVPVGARALVVSNCHLYWHPQGVFTRLVQGLAVRQAVAEVNAALGDRLPVVMAGDFNTLPDDPLYAVLHGHPLTPEITATLLTSIAQDPRLRTLQFDPERQRYLCFPTTPGPDGQPELPAAPLLPVDRQRDLVAALWATTACTPPVTSAYRHYRRLDPAHYVPLDPAERGEAVDIQYFYNEGTWSGEPRFSVYTEFCGLLDYLFVGSPAPVRDQGSGLRVQALLSLPPESRLLPAIPNLIFGSDHLSLMAVLDFDSNLAP
ncbi:RNA exonuclease ngl2 [Tieghemiomyces parasiticus]|uniref:RNA exonuclease ngl2 n=1 Tax=Tieghemiomyces parasiticus TaxID=78921 RepID=A0A9W8E0K0_9FUNG|nr:RNA exonuclease ngl2 [Tieghemiomyces parasiticus]